MSKILIAEDEESIRELIAFNLSREGYEVVEASNGQMAVDIFLSQNDFDLVLLDIMMPELDGIEVCRRIRKVNRNIGIIMLTAKGQDSDKIEGLRTGADDYMTKPFSTGELVARCATVLRRVEMMSNPATKSVEHSGEFKLNMRRRTLSKRGEELELTPVEYQLMEILFAAGGDTVERDQILKTIWGDTFLGEDKIVDVNIRRLRMKVEDNPSEPRHILTVRGIGYRWKE